jgi:hypothetical protein
LVDGGSAGKHGLSIEHLAYQAPQSPDVHRFAVVLTAEQQLGRPVPPGCDIVGHNHNFLVVGLLHEAHQSEIAEFGIAVLVDEYVGGLEVAVDEVGVVQEVDGFGDLVDDVLLVALLEVGGLAVLADEGVQINVHVFEQQVDILVVLRPNGLLQRNDVAVLQLPQKHDLPVGALRVSRVRKGIEVLLQRTHRLRLPVHHLPDVPVRATAYLLHDLVILEDVRLDLIAHATIIYYITNNGTQWTIYQ